MRHIFLWIVCATVTLSAQALTVKNINNDWTWGRGFQPSKTEKVTLPHTWNIQDAMFGDVDYYRGMCKYLDREHSRNIPQNQPPRLIIESL